MSGVRFVGPGGIFATVRATVVVLACGGIENARLLLLSRGTHRNGLGNGYDLVGRFFMDHHRLDWGVLIPSRPELFDSAGTFDLVPGRGGFRIGKLTIAPSALKAAHLLNSSVQLAPRQSAEQRETLLKLGRLISPREQDRRAALSEVSRDWRLMAGLADTFIRLVWHQRRIPARIDGGYWSRMPRNGSRFSVFKLLQTVEQCPSPANRVLLISKRDSLGQPRARVECSLGSTDIESSNRSRSILAKAFMEHGIGVVVPNDGLPTHSVGGMHHHMGTTRMHGDPRKGVTNEYGEVHGVHNLFVVGSSVFPTGGYANPTLTLLALSLRTAAHVASRVARPEPAVVRQ